MAVIVHHMRPEWLPGGFLGVDLFFVLSGYLITSLLLAELARSGTVRLSAFWSRRARRLLPALYLLLVGVALASRWLPTWQRTGVRGDGVAALLYVSNWRFLVNGQQYFDTAGAPNPLLHLWSLAIEEQAYLLWPLVVLAVWRWGRRSTRTIGWVAGVLAAGSIAAMALSPAGDAAYFGTHTRIQAIFIGAVVAAAIPLGQDHAGRIRPAVLQVAGFVSLAVLVAMARSVQGTDAWMYRGGFTVAALAGIAVVVASTAGGPVAWLARLAPLRALGRVSYGLYLIHWPVLVFCTEGRTGLSGWTLDALRLAIIGVLTVGSYRLVEQPIRTGRLTPGVARWATPAAVGLATIAVLAVGIGATQPPTYLQGQDSAGGPVAAATTLVPRPPSPRSTVASTAPPTTAGAEVKGVSSTTNPPITAAPTTLPLPRRITLVGDSVLASLAPGLEGVAQERGIEVVDRTTSGCGVVTNSVPAFPNGSEISWTKDCQAAIGDVQTAAASDRSDLVVVLSTWEAGDRLEGGRHLRPASSEWEASVKRGLREMVDRLGATGSRVVMLGSAPMVPGLVRTTDPSTRSGNAVLTKLEASYAQDLGLGWVDLAPIVCGSGTNCPPTPGGVRLRPDDGAHFSPAGATAIGPAVLQAILGQRP